MYQAIYRANISQYARRGNVSANEYTTQMLLTIIGREKHLFDMLSCPDGSLMFHIVRETAA